MDEAAFKRLESFVAQARVILFTGAGFSLGARNRAGTNMPTTPQLATQLWDLAFPGEAFEESDIQDIYEASVAQAKNETTKLLKDQLSVDPTSIPDYYIRWFSLPWHRIYTLNIDDLPETVDRTSDLPRQLETVSALGDTSPASVGNLVVVHLNGTIRDVPNATFGNRQYAERLANSDAWYALLARELVSHPVVFVGTTLNEPPLWQYVEARGRPTPRTRDLRPGGLLVTPNLTRARAVALRQYRIDWVEGTAETFAEEVLRPLESAAERGLCLLGRTGRDAERTLNPLTDLQVGPAGDEREFLRGFEPRWSDITDGYAIERRSDRELRTLLDEVEPKLVILTGTAASGKSTSAMRLILGLQATGLGCFIANEDGDLRSHSLRRSLDEVDAKALFVPNLERLGRGAAKTLGDLADSHPDLLVISTARSAWYHANEVVEFVNQRDDAVEGVVPNLADEDIEALLDALTSASRLGALEGKTRAQQREVMAKKSDRQLLVAMIEATSGVQFEEKIEDECRQLDPEDRLIYGIAALAMNFRITIGNGELLAAVGGDPADQMRRINDLERVHLLVRHQDKVGLRHRVVAERTVDYLRSNRVVESPLRGLVFSLAAVSQPGALRKTPAGRGLIRLINHKLLIEYLRMPGTAEPDLVGIRGVYEEVEELLKQDYHYWLQRGSFETEVGDLDLARTFLQQAKGLAQDDPFVETQWAYMTLKRASRRPTDPDSPREAEMAFNQLEEQITARGRSDTYPFHIYGSQGLAWAHRALLAPEEKKSLLQRMRAVMDEGERHHRGDRALQKLAKDVDTAYLRLAVLEEE